MGFVIVRRGKGDHTIYEHPETGQRIVIDGSLDHEVPMPVWLKLKKRFKWKR